MPARWVALITAGTIGLLLLGGVGLVGAAHLAQAMQHSFGLRATSNCLPSDFPDYPGSDRAFAYLMGPVCTEGVSSEDSRDQVLSFYMDRLNVSPWRLTRPPAASTIYFGRTDNSNATGELQAIAAQFGSRITITYTA